MKELLIMVNLSIVKVKYLMDFNYFLTHISRLKKLPLGGLDSQFKMAPELRKKFNLQDFVDGK